MKTRKLGWTDLELSTIGLGTWAHGGGGWAFSWGHQEDRDSIDAIVQACAMGVNWIDTAPVYGLGHSEEVLGRALKELPEKPIIATKCGLVWDDDRNISGKLQGDSIRKELEASLKYLDIDVIDLYQIHWPNPEEDIEEAWGTIAELVKEGKIRYAGVSNFSIQQMNRIKDIHPIASLQPPYSMLRPDIEDELLGYCADNQIGVVAYSPMQKGMLSGKMTKERMANVADDDHRRNDPMFQEPQLSINLKFVDKLKTIAEKSNITVAQLSLSWVLRRREMTSAIAGARTPSQIKETVEAGNLTLSEDDAGSIEAILNERLDDLKDIS